MYLLTNRYIITDGTGIISGLNRRVSNGSSRQSFTSSMKNSFLFDLIQTDAAINPGNSGKSLCTTVALFIFYKNCSVGSSNFGVILLLFLVLILAVADTGCCCCCQVDHFWS